MEYKTKTDVPGTCFFLVNQFHNVTNIHKDKMNCKKRQIVNYADASLDKLDAGVCVAYPRTTGQQYWRYYAVPDFFIAGVMKCGTMELHNWLLQHPNLCGISRPDFFNRTLNIEEEWPCYVFDPLFGISEDLEHLNRCDLHTFERTPNYFAAQNQGIHVAGFIHKMVPSGKFLILIRNPTERAYSHYQMKQRQTSSNKINAPECLEYSFSDALTDYLEKKQNSIFSRIFTLGHYADYLENWFQYFSKSQFLILTLDEFKHTPFVMMEKIQQFLNLPYFDYRPLLQQTQRGFWALKGQSSKAYDKLYEQKSEETRQQMTDYYKLSNNKIIRLVHELNVDW